MKKEDKKKREKKICISDDFYKDNGIIILIKLYRKFISPYKRACCRFTPTCSQYAIEALREWGVLFGLSLSFWRILRCNPFSKGGFDPVPENPLRRKRVSEKQEENKIPDEN